MQIPFTGQAYLSRSRSVDGELCINFYPEKGGEQSKSQLPLYSTPGLSLFSNITGNQVRALYTFNGVMYAVVDNTFYSLDTAGTATSRGTLLSVPATGPVDIVSNGTQLMIVDGQYGYTYTLANSSFLRNTSAAFMPPQRVTYQDGYGIFTQQNSSMWWITGLNDFSTIAPLDFASANSTPDNLVAAFSTKQQLYLFKQWSTEVWYNSGDASFPFARRTEALIEQGCAAAFSIARADNTLFWLSQSREGQGYILRLENFVPKVISTDAISYAISTYSTISDAIGYVYQDKGRLFYVLTFPTADRTWVYDASTGAWHERRSQIVNDPGAGTRQGRHRGNCYTFFNNKHYVGDFQSGKIYELTTAVYTENGTTITRRRRTSHYFDELKRLTCSNLEVDVAKGVGLTTGQGSDPQLMLSVSRDGGYTFISKEPKSFGASGQYTTRVQWNRLGVSRDFVLDLSVTDPVDVTILGAYANYEACDS